MYSGKLYAQFQLVDSKAGVDSLSFIERFSFHSNAVDWICETPNVDIEFDIRGNSWGRWSVLVGAKHSIPVWTNVNPYYVLNNKEAHLELRKYWRSHSSRLAAVYYWGLRGSYGNFDIKLSEFGNRGKALFAGVSLGTVRQLYGYPSGNSLDVEFGITVGAAYADNTKYYRESSTNRYVTESVIASRIVPYPVINEIRAGLIYRFGNFPLFRKFRRRYDADTEYRNDYEDRIAKLRQMRIEKHNADSLFNMVNGYYVHCYDSVYSIADKEMRESMRIAQDEYRQEILAKKAAIAERKKAAKEERHAASLQKREERIAEKRARKANKIAEKETKKQEKENAKLIKKEEKIAKKTLEKKQKDNANRRKETLL